MSDAAPRPRGRPGTAADTRARLVAAAVEVFLERGYADTRVQDITDAAGYTTGALYAHFSSRMEILAEALLTAGERLVGQLADDVANQDTDGAGSVATRLADTLTSPTEQFDRLTLEALTLATRDEKARETIVPALNRLTDQLVDTTRAARDNNLIDKSIDLHANSTYLMSIILGGTIIRALDLPRADADRVRELFQLLRVGVAPQADASRPAPAHG